MQFNYHKQFGPRIESGIKIHTFRVRRQRMPRFGEQIHMFTGQRTKYCQRIMGNYYLQGLQPVRMTIRNEDNVYQIIIHIGNKRIWTPLELHQLAINDGFDNLVDFINYWLTDKKTNKRRNKVAFVGICYHWTNFKY